jgi:hypothetical protein
MYLPYLGVGASFAAYAAFAKPIMDNWHEFLYRIAGKFNIPVLDLNRTLDPNSRKHYGKNDTRTSNISSHCIAQCINYIYKNYNGFHVYFAPSCDMNKITVE